MGEKRHDILLSGISLDFAFSPYMSLYVSSAAGRKTFRGLTYAVLGLKVWKK